VQGTVDDLVDFVLDESRTQGGLFRPIQFAQATCAYKNSGRDVAGLCDSSMLSGVDPRVLFKEQCARINGIIAVGKPVAAASRSATGTGVAGWAKGLLSRVGNIASATMLAGYLAK
jgi:hypothetical protein